MMRVINQYSGVDFATVSKVPSISHEHIFTADMGNFNVKNAYDRGIRHFCCINYTPAVTSYPLSGWNRVFRDYLYYDVSNKFKTGGIDGGNKYYQVDARKKVCSDTNYYNERNYSFRQRGLIITYIDENNVQRYERLIARVEDVTDTGWNTVCESNSNWEELTASTYEQFLVVGDISWKGSAVSFVDKDGNTVLTDDLPQIPNAEHVRFLKNCGEKHFNVLGSTFNDCGHGISGMTLAWKNAHQLYDLSDINSIFLNKDNQLYVGKIFGTINHPIITNESNVDYIKGLANACPDVIKAVEIFNQGYYPEVIQGFKDSYDAVLSDGLRLNCVAVVDWQDARHTGVDKDLGCNVLLVDGWDNMTVAEKSEAGLDAYINGHYYASGLGNHHITNIEASEDKIKITFDSSADTLKVISNLGVIESSGTQIEIKPTSQMKYVRFEAYFSDDDFIFTNPFWIEQDSNLTQSAFALGII